MERPDVSVVVITCDDAKRLPRAVESLRRQTLRNLEVIVVDDASADDTELVARRMEGVRYIRRTTRSGGCGAPRNDGLDAARAPYVMFLDSDDELPRHACKSLLTEIEQTGADFVTGQISRLFEETGRTERYYPAVFRRRRVVDGIRTDPDLFLDSFSTNKLYRVDFLRSRGLRFREDLHYEDHVFSAALYCAARRFAVVPWVVYLWHRAAGDRCSISLNLADADNVRHRVRAARASDEILRHHGLADMIPARQDRFVRQDLRVYLNALPRFDAVWAKELAAATRPYLRELEPGVLERADPLLRVCASFILSGQIDDLRVAARSLTGPKAPPRTAVRAAGRTYWGNQRSEADDPMLDITPLHLAELPFSAARLRHEVTETAVSGTVVTWTIRTYDPFGVLNERVKAELAIGTHRVPLRPRPSPDGGYVSRAEVDLAAVVRHRLIGWDGFVDPRIRLSRGGHSTSDRILAEPALTPVTLSASGHEVTICASGSCAVLRTVWRRRGLRRHAPSLLALRRRAIKTLCRGELKLRVYRGLIKTLPRRRDLALFEADCGKAYTGHPRYIHEELRRRGLPLRAVWVRSVGRGRFPGLATVRRMSWRHVWAMARAGWWVDSHGMALGFPKPRGTRYLQTWHGQGVKSVGLNSPDLRGDFPGPREQWRANVARWDALVCPSAEFEQIFIPANEYRGPLLPYGSPRCDVLVHGDASAVRRARDKLEIPDDRRVLLYAPTYRDRAKYSGRSVRADLTLLAEELAAEWVMILRTHPVERFKVPEHVRHFVRPAGGYPEINDLLLAADVLLTDYSSVMCDFAVTGKPIILFADDWDEYQSSERGMYRDLREIAPGPCLTTTAEVIDVLRGLGRYQDLYGSRYTAFRRMWCPRESGHASADVVTAFFTPASITGLNPHGPRP